MANLVDLITEIREDELVEMEASLDSAIEWRIEEKILKAIGEESKLVKYKKPKRKKWISVPTLFVFGFRLNTD